MSLLYRIRGWNNLYETHDSRKLKTLHWIAIPNKFDGLSFRRISKQKDATDIFTAWILLIELASKCDPRGTLIRENLPLSPGDAGDATGFPGKIFERALSFLSSKEIGWIEAIDNNLRENLPESPDVPGKSPDVPGFPPATLQNSTLQDSTVHTQEAASWRTNFGIYEKEVSDAFDGLLEDREWLEERQRYHPNLDLPLSLEKAYNDFWGIEAGWKHKKAKRIKTIDWKATFANALSMKGNQVYKKNIPGGR